MNTFQDNLQIIQNFHELGETVLAAEYLVKEYGLEHPNFKGFELRETAKPNFILMTTEGNLGEKQIIRIPENTFEFDLPAMLALMAHEMVHVGQRQPEFLVADKNEREWQAYYEMIFHKIYPKIPDVSDYYKKFFATKSLEYYSRMGENSDLQKKYENQKKEIDSLLLNLT